MKFSVIFILVTVILVICLDPSEARSKKLVSKCSDLYLFLLRIIFALFLEKNRKTRRKSSR